MKKTALFILLIGLITAFTGCGDPIQVTVYNSIPIYGDAWVAINSNTQSYDQWFWPSSYATKYDEADSSNSITFEAEEGDILLVSANGQYNLIDADGNTQLESFEIESTTTNAVYGGFMENPHWYAAVNADSVVIYKR